MVTPRHSNRYTDYAVSSLVENTKLEPGDKVIVIDNDQAYPGLPEHCRDRATRRVNPKPLGFAANVNQIMELAGEQKSDLVFVNNDIVFSPGWFDAIRPGGPFLTSPLSNAELPYTNAHFECKYEMNIEDYLGNELRFRKIVRDHQKRYSGYLEVLFLTFFAVKIPYEVFSVIGSFNETFGIGGGEDKDYCIRCHEQGILLRYALPSYVLHFHGKSTWRGAETKDQMDERNRTYTERFKQKWGDALFEAFIYMETKNLPQDAQRAYELGDYRRMVGLLKAGQLGVILCTWR